MRLRSHALVLLGALALFWASTVAHGHGDEARLEARCAICAAQVQASDLSPGPTTLPVCEPKLAIELFHPAPLSRDLHRSSRAEARGPPRTA
jgi:hypothetical protein